MRVTMVLPEVMFTTRIGGYRVHYETANRLAERGHQVTIIHKTVSRRVWFRAFWWRVRRRNDLVTWFSFSPQLRLLVVRNVSRRRLRRGICLFTAWYTMVDVPKVGRAAKAAAMVWDYESWRHTPAAEQLAMQTQFAQPGLVRLAGSVAVVEMLDDMSLSSRGPFPPGIDTDLFAVRRDPESRGCTVGFLHRPGLQRGLDDLMTALQLLRETGIGAEVVASGQPFGTDAPRWITWRACPSDSDLAAFYNDVSVFVLPSHSEGLGLPALEAMACGAAVVIADNGGSRQFARHGVNALVVPPASPEHLAAAIEHLLMNDQLRVDIARAGRTTAEAMDWQAAIDNIERELEQL